MSTDATPPTTPPPPLVDTSALPDDPAVLKQMIAELIRALRSERRDKEAVQQRLDALLRRYYAPRPDNPNQPLLFPQPEPEEAADAKSGARILDLTELLQRSLRKGERKPEKSAAKAAKTTTKATPRKRSAPKSAKSAPGRKAA